jgi:hypothetical protein
LLTELPRNTLVLGDRLCCMVTFCVALQAHRRWGVVRRNRLRRRIHGGLLEDWLVRAGTGVSAPVQMLRDIRWRRGWHAL